MHEKRGKRGQIVMKMNKNEIIRGLRIERKCVSRDCNRDCANCDIVQERDWLLQVYDDAIALLSTEPEDKDDNTRWNKEWIK